MSQKRVWIVVVDGDEIKFHKKGLALLASSASIQTFPDTRLLERTTLCFQSGCGLNRDEQKFEIDITNQIPR